jgi:hypothetical protein
MLALPNSSSSARSTRMGMHLALRKLLGSVWRGFGVDFSPSSGLAHSNDNSPKPDPDPHQGAFAVPPVNDNGIRSNSTAAIAGWGVILVAGTVLVAANLGYLPRAQPRLLTVPDCPSTTNAAVARITPDTLISAL